MTIATILRYIEAIQSKKGSIYGFNGIQKQTLSREKK